MIRDFSCKMKIVPKRCVFGTVEKFVYIRILETIMLTENNFLPRNVILNEVKELAVPHEKFSKSLARDSSSASLPQNDMAASKLPTLLFCIGFCTNFDHRLKNDERTEFRKPR